MSLATEGLMRRIFTLVSIAIHSIVIALVFFAQVLDVGALPMPRDLFPTYMDVSIVNPPIPPAPRPPSPVKPADRPAAPNTAPVEAPNGVTKETGRESERIERTDSGLVG